MESRCTYGFGRTVDLDCDTVLKKLTKALEERGFGVLFELEVGELWRTEKRDGNRYVILGACNPKAAARAYSADCNIGLVLPCHLVVYEEAPGRTRIMAADPATFMDLLRRPAAIEMAIEMKEQLEMVVENLV